MPIGTDSAYGQAIAEEARQLEREMELLTQQRQAIAASNDLITPVAERYRAAVRAAKSRLDAAERAYAVADAQVKLKIRQQQPSEQLARLWYEEGVLSPGRELHAAKEQLASAELALGEQVRFRRDLEALEAEAPALHAQIDAECQRRHAEIETRLMGARARVRD